MPKVSKKCQCPPVHVEEDRKDEQGEKVDFFDIYIEEELEFLTGTLPVPDKNTIICYRAACCPSCAPCGPCGSCGVSAGGCGPCGLSGPYPCKSLGVECGGRHDVEITVCPRIDMKEIDACVRCCVCGCPGSCASGCTRCLASPPHNKRPCDPGVPCLPIAPRLPVPFGVRCQIPCPSPPCVPPPCAPVCGAPCCPSKCPPC